MDPMRVPGAAPMTNTLRWTEEDLAAYEQRQRTAGAGAKELAPLDRRSTDPPAPAVLHVIGIDPGVTTGFALYDAVAMKLERVESMGILRAMREVAAVKQSLEAGELFVIFEDARKRKRFDKADKEEDGYKKGARREGVGSVKRDSSIWEEFLLELGVPFKARIPMATKRNADHFQRLTKWTGRTNEHARDAAMIVFGLNASMVRSMLTTYKQTQAGK